MSKKADDEGWLAIAKRNGGVTALLADGSEGPFPFPAKLALKYGNTSVKVDGFTFDSKKESARYQELKYLQKAGQIADLELQPVFPLHIMALWRSQMPIEVVTVGVFTADFRYVDLKVHARGEIVVEDVKSEATAANTAYRLRKKIAEAVHGVIIREV